MHIITQSKVTALQELEVVRLSVTLQACSVIRTYTASIQVQAEVEKNLGHVQFWEILVPFTHSNV